MGDMADFANSMLSFSKAHRTIYTPYPASRYKHDVSCPKCRGHMTLRSGQYGDFFGCDKFPKCNGSRGVI